MAGSSDETPEPLDATRPTERASPAFTASAHAPTPPLADLMAQLHVAPLAKPFDLHGLLDLVAAAAHDRASTLQPTTRRTSDPPAPVA